MKVRDELKRVRITVTVLGQSQADMARLTLQLQVYKGSEYMQLWAGNASAAHDWPKTVTASWQDRSGRSGLESPISICPLIIFLFFFLFPIYAPYMGRSPY